MEKDKSIYKYIVCNYLCPSFNYGGRLLKYMYEYLCPIVYVNAIANSDPNLNGGLAILW